MDDGDVIIYEMQIFKRQDGNHHGRLIFKDFATTASAAEPLQVLDLLWDALNEEIDEQFGDMFVYTAPF